jgi:hypothetical protein
MDTIIKHLGIAVSFQKTAWTLKASGKVVTVSADGEIQIKK